MSLEWEISTGWRNSSFYNQETKKDAITLDVFVADAPRIDQSLFAMWLDGLRAHKREKHSGAHDLLMYDIVYRDVLDQYRLFDMLEYYLQNPDVFSVQHIIQIDMSVFRSLLEKYYEINETVIRELVGKKLTQKLRSSLDDVSDRLKINVKCCRRQFDNMKRLYIYVIENRSILIEYSLVDILHQHFKLSKALSLKYARHIFLFYHRIETADKDLKFLNSADFEYFASVLMNQWTSDKQQLDLDKKFKEDIRDCRTHLLSDKNILDTYKHLVFEKIKADKKTDKKLSNLASKFQVILKALLNIGAGISKSKEFEDIFEDLEDKILDTIISIGLSKSHVDDFFTYLSLTFDPLLDTLTFTRHRQRFAKSWLRYLDGIRLSLLHMYDKKLLQERDK